MKLTVGDFYLRLMVIAAISGSQGCSFMGVGNSDFACPGGIEGVRCMSARQIYQATESSDYVKPTSGSENSQAGINKSQSNEPINFEQPLTKQAIVPRIEQPIPIRTQAKVMRIWTASWEDDDGDLHADGYMYTEIESRRWNLGGRFKSPGTAISPLSADLSSKGLK